MLKLKPCVWLQVAPARLGGPAPKAIQAPKETSVQQVTLSITVSKCAAIFLHLLSTFCEPSWPHVEHKCMAWCNCAASSDCVHIGFDDLGAVKGGPLVPLPTTYHGLKFSPADVAADGPLEAQVSDNAVSNPAYAVQTVTVGTGGVINLGSGGFTVTSANGLPFTAVEVFYASSFSAAQFSVGGTAGSTPICTLVYPPNTVLNRLQPYSLSPCVNVTSLTVSALFGSGTYNVYFDDFTVCGPGVTAAI